MPKTNFENLKVYQLAEKLADEIWEIVIKWDYLSFYRRGESATQEGQKSKL